MIHLCSSYRALCSSDDKKTHERIYINNWGIYPRENYLSFHNAYIVDPQSEFITMNTQTYGAYIYSVLYMNKGRPGPYLNSLRILFMYRQNKIICFKSRLSKKRAKCAHSLNTFYITGRYKERG